MAWQDVSVPTLRHIINDLGSTVEYNDSRLEELLVVAARYIDQEISFSTAYTIDIVNCSIAPEPDDPFINLMVLKAACILARGTQRIDINKGFVIHDGPSRIDGKQVAVERKNMTESYCQEFEDAAEQHRLGNAVSGKAIFGPANISVPHRGFSRSRFS